MSKPSSAGADQALTRFANNAIHQNVAERSAHLSVRPVIDGRTARATTNRLDREGIREVVEQAIAITRLTEPDPDLLPLAEPARVPARATAASKPPRSATPQERARAVAEAIARGGSGGPDRGGHLFHRRTRRSRC